MAALHATWLKTKLDRQPFVLGTFIEIQSPAVIEILGLAGFDFAVIDCEHGAFNPETVEHMIRAAGNAGIVPLVRVPNADPVAIRMPLDMGAAGVHVPQVESLAMAESCGRAARFHPRGERGMQPFVRAASYRAADSAEFRRASNDNVAVVVHVEGRGGVADLEGIIACPGVDVVFLGPYDLSQALGIPGETRDPRVRGVIEQAVAQADGRKVIGTYADTAEDAAEWVRAGVRYVTVSLDAGILLSGAKTLLQNVNRDVTGKV